LTAEQLWHFLRAEYALMDGRTKAKGTRVASGGTEETKATTTTNERNTNEDQSN
jgi:hypothetical protein